MDRRFKVVALATLLAPFIGLVANESAVARADEDKEKGSITGTISVSGVRSPKDVLVYVEKVPGEYPPPKEPVHMDQVKLVFTPNVLPIVKGTTVSFENGDPILHNIFWPKSKSYRTRNLGSWGKGRSKKVTFDKEGKVVLLCNVHSEMEGHIVILQNPFFALVGREGTYEIKDVPPGEYTLNTWYFKPKKLRSKSTKVSVSAGEPAVVDFSLSRSR